MPTPVPTDHHEPADRTRLLGPDMSRGAMLLLIAMAYAIVYTGAGFGADVSQLPPWDRATPFASALLLDNRAFPLFAILFGYWLARGVDARRSREATRAQAYVRILRRAGALLLLGTLHAILVFPGEILGSYGVALLLVGWLLLVRTRVVTAVLGVLGAGTVLVITAVSVTTSLFNGSAEGAAAEYAAVPGYATAEDWGARIVGVPSTLFYVAVAYPLLLLVVIGFRAGRTRLFEDLERHTRVLRTMAAVGIGVSVLAALPAALVSTGVVDLDAVATGMANALQILTGVLGGLGYAALFTLVSARLESNPGPVSRALAAMGARSLTFYVLHSAMVAVILHPDLLGVGGAVGPFGAVLVALGVWGLGLGAAAALERSGRPGPLDALMRRLVDGADAPVRPRSVR